MDQPYESGKRDLLQGYLGTVFLGEFDADCPSLAQRLDRMIEQIESSALPPERAASSSR